MVMFPGGHSRCQDVEVREVLRHKFKVLGKLALEKQEVIRLKISLDNIQEMSNEDLLDIYDCQIKFAEDPLDDITGKTGPKILEQQPKDDKEAKDTPDISSS